MDLPKLWGRLCGLVNGIDRFVQHDCLIDSDTVICGLKDRVETYVEESGLISPNFLLSCNWTRYSLLNIAKSEKMSKWLVGWV